MSKELEYGKWYPISVYYENQDKLDWAIVQFKETKTSFMPLPYIAEYIKRDRVWITRSDKDRYLCELCEPIAFMLWKPYEEETMSKGLEALKRLGNYYVDGIYSYSINDMNEYKIIEKELKALDVIKKKRVDVYCLLQCKSVEEYNDECFCKDDLLTQEEFDILKEVLENE